MSGQPGSLTPLFDPQVIAIIGASDNVLKFGGRPIRFMKEAGYAGTIYPVNPRGGVIQGLQAYTDIREVPETVDMCVVTVPAPLVVEAVANCAAAGVRSVVIFSSGFAEVSEEGAQWQAELDAIARSCDIRMVGPNCMGMLNAASFAVGTFASSFERGWPKSGNISVISQSGAVGGHIMVLCRERGLGIRNWITTGNEVDVDVNRPRFTGERLVQILGCFFMCVQGFIEHLLCFVRRDISDGAVKTLGVVPIDPFQRFPFKLAH